MKSMEIIEAWLKVQAVWLYLEPVFQSDDIKEQLPREAILFLEVDKAWRKLIEKVVMDPKALTVTKLENLIETLDDCNAKLDNVTKRLNQYLERKRKNFPRFFFLSNEELLEILSETKEPLRVQKHLKKCFEGINALEFDSEKKIHGMESPEGEKVKFVNIVDPMATNGAVEVWLGEVEETMVKSVRDVVSRCIIDYTKRRRDQCNIQHI